MGISPRWLLAPCPASNCRGRWIAGELSLPGSCGGALDHGVLRALWGDSIVVLGCRCVRNPRGRYNGRILVRDTRRIGSVLAIAVFPLRCCVA